MSIQEVLSNSDSITVLLISVMNIFSPVHIAAVSDTVALNDYRAGSGLTTNLLRTSAIAIAISFALIMGVWAIISELRAWGTDQGDSFDLGSTIIRACILFAFIGIVVSIIN